MDYITSFLGSCSPAIFVDSGGGSWTGLRWNPHCWAHHRRPRSDSLSFEVSDGALISEYCRVRCRRLSMIFALQPQMLGGSETAAESNSLMGTRIPVVSVGKIALSSACDSA